MALDWSLAVFALLVVMAGSSGAIFKPGAWYEGLRKPSWTPPNWAFPVVWSILYVMIAIAGWLVWRADSASAAMALWGAQLVLNALWSGIFFGARRIDWALGEVAILWLSIAGFILAAWQISTTAALLFVPYLAWVSTAAALNWSVLRLNRTADAATSAP